MDEDSEMNDDRELWFKLFCASLGAQSPVGAGPKSLAADAASVADSGIREYRKRYPIPGGPYRG